MTNSQSLRFTLRSLPLLLALVGFSFFVTDKLQAQACPIIQAFPLQDVPGFPQTDSLVLCGVPDTLAILVFPSPGATYPNGLNITYELPAGMQYAGSTGLGFPGPTVSEADVSDVENPVFLVEGVGPGQVIALYITIEANCELVPPEEAPVNLVIEYVADQFGTLSSCVDEIRPLGEYNQAYRIPVVNIIGGAPVVNGECVLTFEDFSTEYCDTLIISQDGIEAYLDSFNIFVEGLDLVNLNLTRIEVNDMPFNTGGPNYNYDPATLEATMTVTEDFFPGNFDPNGFPTGTDLDFNENEQVTAVFCFTANECASVAGQIITFGASYSCYDKLCFAPSEKEVAIAFMPNFTPEPLIESGVVQTAEICGDNFIVEFEISSDNVDALEGLYQNLDVRFPVCPGLSPVAAEVFNWDTNTFVPLIEETVAYNTGTPCGDPAYAGVWSSDRDFAPNSQVQFNFNCVVVDVDGTSGGITDADGDGIFDDLPGDQSFRVRFEFEFVCQAAADAPCEPLDCLLENAEVRGVRSCGQTFQETDAGIVPPVEFAYGSMIVTTSADSTENLSFGYQLQENVAGGANPDRVDRGAMGTTGTYNISHGYDFNQANLTPCANGETKLVVDIVGSIIFSPDIDYEVGTAMFWQGGVASAVPAGDVTYIPVVAPLGDTTGWTLTINVGTVSNPATGTIDSFTYNLQLDECWCTSRGGALTSKIIETCPDCTEDCDIVKSCIDIPLRDDASSCLDCICDLPSQVVDMNRISTGFTDKSTMTRLDTSQTDEIDTRRYLPGDTMSIRSQHVIDLLQEEIDGLDSRIHLAIRNTDVTYTTGFTKGSVLEQTLSQTPALWDPVASRICQVWIQKGGEGPLTPAILPAIQERDVRSDGTGDGFGCMMSAGATLTDLGYPVNDPGLPRHLSAGSNDDFYDTRYAILYIDAPCTRDFYDLNDLSTDDVLYVDWKMVLVKNPGLDPGLDPITPAVGAITIMYDFNENAALDRSNSGSCLPPIPYEFHCPGPITVANDLTLTADGCGAIMKQTYTLENPIPDGWYLNEYRPIMGVAFADITIPPNIAFCGDVNILDETGANIGTVPTDCVDFPGMTQVTYSGQDYYIAAPGATEGNIRIEDAEFKDGVPDQYYGYDGPTRIDVVANAVLFDLNRFDNRDVTMVGGTFPLLGVGAGQETCNFMLEYNFKRICQENVDATTITTNTGSSYLQSYFYGADTENYTSAGAAGGYHISLIANQSAPEYLNGQTVFDNGGLSDEGAVQEVSGVASFWPYNADLFVNQNEYSFIPGQFEDANNGGGDPTPFTITNQGVGRNPNNWLDTITLVNFVDLSANFPSLVVSTDFNLIADAQNADDINFYEVCAGLDGGADLENMVSTIEVPQAVQLVDIIDQGANNLVFTLIGTTATTNIYSILHQAPGETLSPGECYRMEIRTELLFCPVGLDFPTNVVLSSTASCLNPELSALLSSEAGGACLAGETEYEYISEEADLQVEFFIPEGGLSGIGLCDEFCIGARVKNVKTSPLINLNSIFFLPTGLDFVPGSWEISYPGGPNNYGNGVTGDMVDLDMCTDTEAWESVPDPQEIAPEFPRGTTYGYDWPVDLLGQAGGTLDAIIASGLPGVSTQTSIDNTNEVAFRFRVRTVCDEFTSGTAIRYINLALDPCETEISSNLTVSEPIIVEDADPADFAQLLTVADPSDVNCGEMGTLNISTINTSMTEAVTLDARQCLNIPTDGITYVSGSLIFIEPAGFDGMVMEEDIMGPDGMGGMTVVEKQICFNVPDNLAPGEFYQLAFNFEIGEDVDCDQGEISVEIATVLEDQTCAALGQDCSVAVLNSVNPVFAVEFLPPLDLENFEVTSACDNDPTTLVYAYMFDLTNPGPDFMNSIDIDVIRDLNQNGMLDNFELDPLINPILAGPTTFNVNLPMGGSTSITGEFNVPADIGCPAFLRVRQNSACACDETVQYIEGAVPEFFGDLGDEVVLCPGSPLILDVCGDFAPSAGNDYIFTNGNGTTTVNFMGSTVMIVESDPVAAIDFSLSGDDLIASLNAGFGMAGAEKINLTVNQGFCQETYTLNVRAAPDLDLDDLETIIVCEGDKTVLDLDLSAILEASATISWSPTTFLDDPTSPRPQICNPTDDIDYIVTVSLGDSEVGCMATIMVPVEVEAPGLVDLMYTGEVVCYDDQNPGVLTASAGFVNYQFFVLVGGTEITVQNGASNVYNVPGPGGTYFVRVDDGSNCGLVSGTVPTPGLPCDECPDVYNGPGTLTVCAGETLDSIKVFTGSTAIDGIAFVLFDSQQLDADDVYNYAATGGSVLGSTTAMVMTPDTMATIYDVAIPTMAGDYYVYAILNPTPEQASCRPLVEVVVTVNPLPIADMAMDEACEDASGNASFVLSDYDGDIDIVGGNTVTYHITEANAEDGVNAITDNPYMTSVDITIYVRVETADGCYAIGELILQANQLPMVAVNGGDQEYCDGETPPALFVQNPGTGFTVEWFVDAASNTAVSGVMVGGFNNESITLTAGSSPALPAAGSSVTVYAQIVDDATGCISIARTPITLTNNPTPMAIPASMTVCENDFQSRIGTFDLSTVIDDVNATFTEGDAHVGGAFTGSTGMTLTFHELMSDAQACTNAVVDPSNYMNTALGSQTLFAALVNGAGCKTVVQVQLNVSGQPDADPITITVCPDLNMSTASGIDLTGLEATVAGGNAPGSFSVTWYSNITLTTAVADPSNVVVVDGMLFYAVIAFNAAPMCENVAVVTYVVDDTPEVVDIALEYCEDEALQGEVAGINLRDNDITVAGGLSQIVNWYEDAGFTTPVPDPTDVTVDIGTNGAEANIFYAEVSNGTCVNQAIVEITIFEQPVPLPGGPYEVCAESTVTLSGASLDGSATMGMWTVTGMPAGGDGVVTPMGLLPDPAVASFTASVPGDYTLTLTTDDPTGPCPPNSEDVIVTVHPLPVALPPMAEVCAGSSVEVDGTPTEGTAPYVTHTWVDLGTGTATGYALSNTSAQVVTVDASGVAINAGAGTVDLEYTVIDSNGCTDSGTTTVTIHPLPIPNPVDDMVCVGDAVMIDGAPTQGTTPYVAHTWVDLGTGTADAAGYTLIGASMQVVTVDASTATDAQAGTVVLEYTVEDVNGCSQSETVTVTINPLPEVTPMDGNITCEAPQEVQLDVTTNAASPSYEWTGPGIVSGANTATPTVNLPGTYTVVVTDGITGCMNEGQAFVTQDPLSKCLPATFEIKVKGGE